MLVWRFVAHLGLAPVLLGACYTYHPIQTPSPEQKVSVVLTDSGRVESARQIGPETQRIEGSVLSADDTAYLLAVAGVSYAVFTAMVRFDILGFGRFDSISILPGGGGPGDQ